LQISRERLSEGQEWGNWQISNSHKQNIESILGQWMLFYKEQTDDTLTDDTLTDMEISSVDFIRRFRIIETDKTTYDLWIRVRLYPQNSCDNHWISS
jgi:hypothetical protein